jgi:accessory gene regulator protein AgrB
MNGYIAFYKGKQIEVYAPTSYEAQQLAAKQLKAKKSYEVTVMLAERDGEQVTHTAEN